jgi:UDP-glucuronate decarboxylase
VSAPGTSLVTGGAGFLGSQLVDRLIARGETVFCLDDFSSGSRANVAHLAGHPRFELIVHDVCRPLEIAADRIYNLACPASPVHYQRDPVLTTRTAVLGALNMLALADRLRCPILQASTSEVYGDPAMHPQTEVYWGHVNPIGVRACYNEGKRCAETLFFDSARMAGTRIKVAHIFNTYGPRMQPDDGRVVSNFIVQALAGDPITLHGAGAQTRSFCYVDDLVDGLVRLMDSPDAVTGPVNLGNPEEVSMRALAALVIELTGSHSALEMCPAAGDDPARRCPDTALAAALLGWAPRVGLRVGLARTIAWFAGAV